MWFNGMPPGVNNFFFRKLFSLHGSLKHSLSAPELHNTTRIHISEPTTTMLHVRDSCLEFVLHGSFLHLHCGLPTVLDYWPREVKIFELKLFWCSLQGSRKFMNELEWKIWKRPFFYFCVVKAQLVPERAIKRFGKHLWIAALWFCWWIFRSLNGSALFATQAVHFASNECFVRQCRHLFQVDVRHRPKCIVGSDLLCKIKLQLW